jgi:hypothetical protein
MTTSSSTTRHIHDVDGRPLAKGDTIATLHDNQTARVTEVRYEFETGFVRIKPLQHPYSKGEWHAADRVQKIGTSSRQR